MIVTHSCDQPTVQLPNSDLSGVQLISENDGGRYCSMYEARLEAGQSATLRSPTDQPCVHFYYVINGSGSCNREDGKGEYEVCHDTLIALSSDNKHTLKVSTQGGMRLLVVYFPDTERIYKSLQLVKRLSDLTGTDRDVVFGAGQSRRFTVKQDGFPLTIAHTLIRANTSSKQEYRNHIETCYFVAGKMTYQYPTPDGQWTSDQTKIDARNGTNFFMNNHDKHIADNAEMDSVCISVFDPPLTGNEVHDYSREDAFSSY